MTKDHYAAIRRMVKLIEPINELSYSMEDLESSYEDLKEEHGIEREDSAEELAGYLPSYQEDIVRLRDELNKVINRNKQLFEDYYS